MGVDVTWYDRERAIIYCEVKSTWTMDDFNNAYNSVIARANEINQPVYIICNIVQSGAAPKGNFVRPIQMVLTSEQIKLVVIVNKGVIRFPVARAILAVLEKMLPITEVLYANTNEEAYQLLDRKS